MADHAVVDKIILALAEYLKRDAAGIKPAHHLRDDLGLDSMAVIELLYKIEEAFNIQIPDQDLVGLTTVASVATYVEGRVTPAASPTAQKTASAQPKKSAKPVGKTPKKAAKPAAKKPAKAVVAKPAKKRKA
ncbi:MAG: acyl carrier protein [Nitrospira sp.]